MQEEDDLGQEDVDRDFQAELESMNMEETEFYMSKMGIETVKQYNAAANLIQRWQLCMLFGDKIHPSIASDPNVKAVWFSCMPLSVCQLPSLLQSA